MLKTNNWFIACWYDNHISLLETACCSEDECRLVAIHVYHELEPFGMYRVDIKSAHNKKAVLRFYKKLIKECCLNHNEEFNVRFNGKQ